MSPTLRTRMSARIAPEMIQSSIGRPCPRRSAPRRLSSQSKSQSSSSHRFIAINDCITRQAAPWTPVAPSITIRFVQASIDVRARSAAILPLHPAERQRMRDLQRLGNGTRPLFANRRPSLHSSRSSSPPGREYGRQSSRRGHRQAIGRAGL